MRAITFDIETKLAPLGHGKIDPMTLSLTVVGIHDEGRNVYESFTEEELPRLWPILEQAELLIGFNSDSFDIPLLNRYYPGNLTSIPSLDLLAEVQKALGRRIRLDALAQGTLKAQKSGNGLEAGKWWEEGKYDAVREYCLQDVRLTRSLYEYALAHRVLKYKDLQDIKEIKIDTSSWHTRAGAPALTKTLGL